MANEAVKFVWEGAIPLQIHLHKPEVASHPAPPPALVLAPRIGYLPLLVALIKPYFKESLPPGEDSIWFDYKGFPLKWYIPTGVLFDLLCAEPERPWNLTGNALHYGTPLKLSSRNSLEKGLKQLEKKERRTNQKKLNARRRRVKSNWLGSKGSKRN